MSHRLSEAEALLRHTEWTVIRRLDGLLAGDCRNLFYGPGVELAALREYNVDDDTRHMDWNATARLQIPHVQQHIAERVLTAWFLLDLSASSEFGSRHVTKRTTAIQFVAAIAGLLARGGNRIGALIYGDSLEAVMPPRTGRAHVRFLLEQILARSVSPNPAPTNLRDFFGAALPVLRRRSVVFVVSDFISATGWTDLFARLAQRHETVAVTLSDPAEIELPEIGLATLRDMETGESLFVDTRDESFRARFSAIVQRRKAELHTSFRRAGADILELSTASDVSTSVLRFVDSRKRRSRITGVRGRPQYVA